MSQYTRVPSQEGQDDVQEVELSAPALEYTNEIIESETTPMVAEQQITTINSSSSSNNSNDDNNGNDISNNSQNENENVDTVRVLKLSSSTDGVWSNLTAKPEKETEKEELPPPYETAAADAAPPYWETTIIAPGMSGDEIFVEGLPVGNVFSFVWNMLVSMSFQFVGFLLTYLLHTNHAAKNGSRAGLGFTLVQYGFYLRGRALQEESYQYYGDDDDMNDKEMLARSAWL
ncbi:4767_t:CDS:2, partial [Ambispora gerdemannii]